MLSDIITCRIIPAGRQERAKTKRTEGFLDAEGFNDFLETVVIKPRQEWRFLYCTGPGMRIGELLAPTYDDINLEEKDHLHAEILSAIKREKM